MSMRERGTGRDSLLEALAYFLSGYGAEYMGVVTFREKIRALRELAVLVFVLFVVIYGVPALGEFLVGLRVLGR